MFLTSVHVAPITHRVNCSLLSLETARITRLDALVSTCRKQSIGISWPFSIRSQTAYPETREEMMCRLRRLASKKVLMQHALAQVQSILGNTNRCTLLLILWLSLSLVTVRGCNFVLQREMLDT